MAGARATTYGRLKETEMNKFEVVMQEAIKRRRRPSTSVPDGQHTIGEFISAVFSITNEQDAREFYEGYLLYLENLPDKEPSNFTDEQIAKRNIGWCFGEGIKPNMVTMWSNVCQAYHPVFGVSTPSPKEAFEAGLAVGEKAKEKQK